MKPVKERLWIVPTTTVLFTAALLLTVLSNKGELSFKFSYLSLIPLASAFVNSYLLFKIARRRSQVKSILWFCIFIISVIFWSIADILAFSANNPETGLFARNFVVIPAVVGAPAFYIFIKDTISDKTENLIGSRILLLANSFFYLVIALSTNYIFIRDPNSLAQRFWGYEIKLGHAGIPYIILTQIIIYMSAVAVYRYYRSQKVSEQKKQAKIFLLSIVVPTIGISATNLIPALFAWPWIPIDSLYMTVMAIFIVYGLNKYQLFTINPTRIANNILETMSESVIVTNNSFEIHYMNYSAIKLLNYNPQKESEQAYLKDFVAEDHFKKIKYFINNNKLIKSKKRFSELNVIAKHTGSITPIDLSVNSVLDDKKGSAGYVFVLSDLSELQKAYSQLAEQEQRVEKQVQERTKQLYEEHAKLEASISGLPIGFIMLDEHMKIIEQNEVARSLFRTRENNLWYIQDALEEMGVEKRLLNKLSKGNIIDIPEVVRGNRFLHIIISPIVSEGKTLGRVILIEDITDQKAAERERNEFVVTASHEIRTPLSVIQGNLSNVLDLEEKIDPVLKPLIGSAYRASNQISSLFNDILIVSDIENEGRPKPKFETKFTLKDAVKEVIEHLEPLAKEKRLNISFKSIGQKVQVIGDRDEIKECILKLVDNAIKFTKEGSVDISLRVRNNNAIVEVADSGKGISKSEEKRLFRKFIRLDNSLKREVGGAGLGLYIAKALAERNGGELVLEKSSNKGSVFSLTLGVAKK
ncbi:MAG: PAS domain S-box protein [Candidatus Nomurabacteria bacterium]|nr:MAG: PAS domain S-box protein [Candidatus Nomurabacteria bacterium]HRV75825.1 ATP-binding protein [Candidatus Saccharimonadales bacterium]